MKFLKPFWGVKKLPRELAQIEIWAKKVIENEEIKKFLWEHTRSEGHFDNLMHTFRNLSELRKQLVTWKEVEEDDM